MANTEVEFENLNSFVKKFISNIIATTYILSCDEQIDKLMKYGITLSERTGLFENEFKVFIPDFNTCIEIYMLIMSLLGELLVASKKTNQPSSLIPNLIENIRNSVILLFDKFDTISDSIISVCKTDAQFEPHLYYTKFSDNQPIELVGILGRSGFISELGLKTDRIILSDEVVNTLTVDDVNTYFNGKSRFETEIDESSYKMIFRGNVDPCFLYNKLIIYFEIENELPHHNMSITFTSKPKGIVGLLPFIRKERELTRDELRSIELGNMVIRSQYKRWLHSKNREAMFNPSFDEYDRLDPNLRDCYHVEQTTSHVFHIDYVFNELLNHPSNKTIVNPDMLTSFRELAYATAIMRATE